MKYTLFSRCILAAHIIVTFIAALPPLYAASAPPTSIVPQAAKVSAKLLRRVATLSADSLIKLADEALAQGDNTRAATFYMMTAHRTTGETDTASQTLAAKADMRLGSIYYRTGDYTRAMQLFTRALKSAGESGDKDVTMETYKWMGNVYCMFTEYDIALRCYSEGLAMRDSPSDSIMTYRILMNTCYAYTKQGNTDKAMEYYRRGLATPHGRRADFTFSERMYLGLIHEAAGRYQLAATTLRPLVAFAKAHKLPPVYECSAYECLYRVYYIAGKRDSTLLYLEKCLDTAERSGLLHMFSEALDMFARYYSDSGDSRAAAAYRQRYSQLVDSTFNLREFGRAKDLQFLYEIGKIDSELSQMEAEKERNHSLIRLQQAAIVAFAGVALAITVLLLVVWRQKRKLHNSYRSLFNLNKKLLAIQTEPSVPVSTDMPDEPANGCEQKYSSSNLDDSLRDELLAKIADVMDNTLEYADADFSLERLAGLVGSNSKYVSQVINGHYGKNFSSFVNDYRVRLACKRLADAAYGMYTVEGIGRSVGFRSKTTFTSAFRRSTGLTPYAWQKMEHERRSYAVGSSI